MGPCPSAALFMGQRHRQSPNIKHWFNTLIYASWSLDYSLYSNEEGTCQLRFVSRILFKWSAILQYCNADDVEFTRMRFWPHNEVWRILHTMLFYLSHWDVALWGWWSAWHFNWFWRLCMCQCWPSAFWKTIYSMVSFFKWCEQKAYTICRELWNQLLDVQLPVEGITWTYMRKF